MSTASGSSFRHRSSSVAIFLLSASLALAAKAQNYGQQPGPPQPGYGQQGDSSLADPPSRVARVSVLQGNVSLQPAGVEDFSPAGLNYPLTTGDRLFSDNGAITELEAGQLAIRLGSTTDLSVTAMTDQLEQFGLGQGSIHVRSYDLDPNSTLEIDTPNVAVTVLAPGDLRVDVSPDGTTTQVTLLSGQARVDGQGFQQQLQPGESLQLTGSGPVYAQDVRRPRGGDNLDRFSSDRDRTYQSAITVDSDYVSPDTIGAADLGQYGDWSNDGDSGPVWYPRGVSVDWQPYSVGHWAYIAPWGWTWVENEPWGFAPFHYGRWARFGPRWGWIPGPHVVRPVYSPALVAFVGGGVGVTAWFPLGPREVYTPWYRTSPLYANRINVTNIYNRNTVEVRNIYNQRNTNVYINNTTVNNRVFVNRQVATVAIPQAAFAGGRPVHEVSMRVPPQQFANAPVLSRPNVTPTRSIMAPAPAHALPPHMDRPLVQSRAPLNNGGGFQPGGNRPGGFGNAGGVNNGNGQPNGGNRSGGFGSQPGTPNGSQFPTRGNPTTQQPAQPAQAQPVRGSTAPVQPQPGEGRQGPPRTFESNPTPGQYRPGQGANAPGASAPVTGNQAPARGTGAQAAPPLRGQPGMTIAPAPTAPSVPAQAPSRGYGDGQAPPLRGTPGRQLFPAPIAPVGQPPAAPTNFGQGGRDLRQPTTSAPPQERVPQQPSSNARVWQQPNQTPPQNRPQPPAQAPREVPMRIQPQPAAAPQRQIAPQPAPRPPAPAPRENRPAREDDKHK